MDPFLKLLTHNLLTYDSLTYDSIIIPALKTLVNLTDAITPDEPDKQRRRYRNQFSRAFIDAAFTFIRDVSLRLTKSFAGMLRESYVFHRQRQCALVQVKWPVVEAEDNARPALAPGIRLMASMARVMSSRGFADILISTG